LDDHRAALRLVAAGIGVTVLPRLAVAELPDEVVAVPLAPPTVRRRIVVHAREDRRHGNLITHAVAQLRDSAAKL
jgi:DNA-binding transcriptional LysR family regulator